MAFFFFLSSSPSSLLLHSSLLLFPVPLSPCFYCSKINMVKSIAFTTIKYRVQGHSVHSHGTPLSMSWTLASSKLRLQPLNTNPEPFPQSQVITPLLPAVYICLVFIILCQVYFSEHCVHWVHCCDVSEFSSFFWWDNIALYLEYSWWVHLWGGTCDKFCLLVVVNNAAVDMGVHVSESLIWGQQLNSKENCKENYSKPQN